MTAATHLSARLKQITRHLRVPLFGNAYFLILTNVLPAASGFFFWTLAARLMPAEQVGWGSTLISVTTLLVTLFGLDIGTGLIRYVPLSIENSSSIVNTAFWARTLLAGLAALIFLAGAPVWSPALTPIRSSAASIAMFLAGNVVLSVAELLEHVFVAYRSAQYALLKSLIVGLGRFPIVILLVLANAASDGYSVYLSVVAASALAIVVSIVWFLPKAFAGYRLNSNARPALFASMARYSFKNYLVSFLLQLPGLAVPLLVVNSSLGATGAGVAYVVSMMAWAVVVIPAAVSRSLLAEGSHEADNMPHHLRRAVLFSFLLMSVPLIVLVSVGPMLLGLLFGPVYRQLGSGMLIWMSLGGIPTVFFATYVSLKRVRHEMLSLTVVAAIACLVSLGLGFMFLNAWGLEGLAAGLSIGQWVGGVWSLPEIVKLTRSARPGS